MNDPGPKRAWYPPDDDGFRQWVMDRREWVRSLDRCERLCPFIKRSEAIFQSMIALLEEPEPKQRKKKKG